jgi:hypothetical protein
MLLALLRASFCSRCWRWCCFGGNSRSGSPGSDNGDAQSHSSLVAHCFGCSHWLAVVLRQSGVSPHASTMVSLGGVAPQRLNKGCVLCCVHREKESVWRCGGVDGKPGERLHFGLTPWRWVHRERGGVDLGSMRAQDTFFGFPRESTMAVAEAHKLL